MSDARGAADARTGTPYIPPQYRSQLGGTVATSVGPSNLLEMHLDQLSQLIQQSIQVLERLGQQANRLGLPAVPPPAAPPPGAEPSPEPEGMLQRIGLATLSLAARLRELDRIADRLEPLG